MLVLGTIKIKENLGEGDGCWNGSARNRSGSSAFLHKEKLYLSKGSTQNLIYELGKHISWQWCAECRALSTKEQPLLSLMSDSVNELY